MGGFWYIYARDVQLDEMRHYRVDRLLDLERTATYFTSKVKLTELKKEFIPKTPIRLHGLLTKKGVQRCLENRFLAKGVQIKPDKTGELSLLMESRDLEFTADYLFELGKEVTIIEPKELIDLMIKKAQDILERYQSSK